VGSDRAGGADGWNRKEVKIPAWPCGWAGEKITENIK
jgi:hypothetical protein